MTTAALAVSYLCDKSPVEFKELADRLLPQLTEQQFRLLLDAMVEESRRRRP